LQAFREVGFGKAFKFGIYTLALVPYRWMLFPQLRAPYLRLLGARIEEGAIIHDVQFFNMYRTGFRGLEIGRSSFIGDECLFDLADRIVMADNVTLAERVTILTHTNVGYHDHPLQAYFPAMSAPVRLESGCFVGVNATLLPGITIGEGGFVTAGAVVTKDVPAWHVVGGVPARVLKKLPPALSREIAESDA
jgi:acetyltransferase-like isoleucine patch superfamily enzyme